MVRGKTSGPRSVGGGSSLGRAVAAGLVLVALAGQWFARSAPAAWLGVTVGDARGPRGPAASLSTILGDSPAERAGLRAGDLVVRTTGQPVRAARDLIRAVKLRHPGSRLLLTLERAGQELVLEAALAAKPADIYRRLEADRDRWQQPERVLDVLAVRAGEAVADLGAGGGYFTERLAERVGPTGRVVAIDVDPEAVADLHQRFPAARFPQDVVRQDTAGDPGLEPQSFDAVLLVDTFHELAEPGPVLTAIRHALRENGRLALIDRPATEVKPGAHAVPEAHVVEQATAAGFHVRARHDLPHQFFLILE